MSYKSVTFFFVVAMIFSLMTATNVLGATVSNEEQLRGVIAQAGNTPTPITLMANIELARSVNIPTGANITLRSSYGAMFSLIATYGTPIIVSGGKLTIENIQVTSEDGRSGIGVIIDEGTFTMKSGIISGNRYGVYNTDTFIMNGGAISENVDAGVRNIGTFTMNRGAIHDNVKGDGVGTAVDNFGTFTMNGGTISNTNGSGVANSEIFNMNGGTISGNTFTGVINSNIFTMHGGVISGNSMPRFGGGVVNTRGSSVELPASRGGGMHTWEGGTFIMYGGWIFGNTAPEDANLHVGELSNFQNNIIDSNLGGIGSRPPAGAIIDLPFDDGKDAIDSEPPVDEIIDSSLPTPSVSTEIRLQIGSTTYTLDGAVRQSDVAPFTRDGRTMVPLRLIAEALGANVGWNGATQTVSIESGNVSLSLVLNIPLPNNMGTPINVDGSTFVPITYVAEMLGATTSWDAVAQAVYIYQ